MYLFMGSDSFGFVQRAFALPRALGRHRLCAMFGVTQSTLKQRADYFWATAQFLQAAANLASYGDHTVWCAMQGQLPGSMGEVAPAAASASVEELPAKLETQELKPPEKVAPVEPPSPSTLPFKSPQEMFKAADMEDQRWQNYKKKQRSEEMEPRQTKEPDAWKKHGPDTDTVEKKPIQAKKMPRPPSHPPTSSEPLGASFSSSFYWGGVVMNERKVRAPRQLFPKS